jgi:hypothetical protein
MFGNSCTRVVAPPGLIEIRNDFLIADSGQPDEVAPNALQVEVRDLPDDVLIYLLGSRYCDTQKLSDLAWSLFGGVPAGWQRVQAICDYAHDRICFGYQHARCDRTASEGHAERVGVCRDFAHLAVTLCRCMNIPARYCTGYLGDIGVPPDPAPQPSADRPHRDGAGPGRGRCRDFDQFRPGPAGEILCYHRGGGGVAAPDAGPGAGPRLQGRLSALLAGRDRRAGIAARHICERAGVETPASLR